MFGHTFGTLFENCLEEIEISKSNETLPDHFSMKNKASHEVERQIRSLLFCLNLFEKCCLTMSVNRLMMAEALGEGPEAVGCIMVCLIPPTFN